MNLKGMGVGSRVLRSESDYEAHTAPAMGYPEKAESAAISYKYWKKAESETRYTSPRNG